MKTKTSALYSHFAGRIGNAVASQNKQGLYLRQYVYPRKPVLDTTNIFPPQFRYLINAWRIATDVVKAAYKSVASSYTFTDAQDNVYTPSSFQLFMYLNMNVASMHANIITNPVAFVLPPSQNATFDDYQTISTTFYLTSWTWSSAFDYLLIYASIYYPPSCLRTNPPLFFIAQVPAPTVFNWDVGPFLRAVLGGAPAIGQQFFVQTYRVDRRTGILSTAENLLINVYA